MSADRIDPDATADAAHGAPESNGVPASPSDGLARDVVLLRARCSNLRHW